MAAHDDQHRIAALCAARDVDQGVGEGAAEGSARAAAAAVPNGIVAGNVRVAVAIVQLVVDAKLKGGGARASEQPQARVEQKCPQTSLLCKSCGLVHQGRAF